MHDERSMLQMRTRDLSLRRKKPYKLPIFMHQIAALDLTRLVGLLCAGANETDEIQSGRARRGLKLAFDLAYGIPRTTSGPRRSLVVMDRAEREVTGV